MKKGAPEPTDIEHKEPIVRARMRTPASAEQVWIALADADRISQWFTDRARGRAVAGDKFTWYFERFGSEFAYDVRRAERPRRLVLEGAPPGQPKFLLEIEIRTDPDGTHVEVANSGFGAAQTSPEEIEGIRSGWEMVLALLKEYVERHFGQPRQSFFAMQPATFEYEQILHYFLSDEGLAAWLTSSGRIGAAGEPYRTELKSGRTMSGRVLCVTSREVALAWDEISGAIELKSFRLGPRTRAVCVRGTGWELSEQEAMDIEREMVAAIDCLVAELAARNEPS